MRKNLFFILCLLFTALPTNAVLTTEESISQEYLHNNGFSEELTRLINLNCTRSVGKRPEIEISDPNYYKNFNWVRKFFIYLDPALDDGSFMRHDIKVTPSIHDL